MHNGYGAARIYHDGHYLTENPTWHREDSDWKARQALQLLRRSACRPSTVVEVGCGVGGVVTAVAAGLSDVSDAQGWDTAEAAIAEAGRLHHDTTVTFHHGDVFERDGPRFDLALVFDVVEHVEDPFGFCRDVAAQATHALFHIPLEMNVSAVVRRAYLTSRQRVGHIHYFARESAEALLRESGHRIVGTEVTKSRRELRPESRTRTTRSMNMLRAATEAVADVDTSAMLLGGYSLLALCETVDHAPA